jgi:EAL domain-containing protein (putative c-di-GMP-specific phosphodiesterase class I)
MTRLAEMDVVRGRDLANQVDDAATGSVPVTASAPLVMDRDLLIKQLRVVRQEKLKPRQVFLVVINIADTKKYDEIIRIFGYKFADDLLKVRLDDLDFLGAKQSVYHVGFWSIGLIYRVEKRENYEESLGNLIEHLSRPIICRGIPVPIQAGVGVCDLMRGLGSVEDLLQSTFLAGQIGRGSAKGWAECNYELEDDHRRAFSIISEVGHSLTTLDEFELLFQPRIDLKTNRCSAVEALLRWHHPVLGLIAPDEFIPLVEMTGLIRELTSWVLQHAIAQTAQWHKEGHKLKVCVNISSRNLTEEDFVERLAMLLARHGVRAEYLELEFSENQPFHDLEAARNTLVKLRDVGVSIAIDDFGTGRNSLEYLESVPANVLKLDRSLINSLSKNLRHQVMVKSIIMMAHDLGMVVVAEGLESQMVMAQLVSWRCDYAQGYIFCRPMRTAEFLDWFTKSHLLT